MNKVPRTFGYPDAKITSSSPSDISHIPNPFSPPGLPSPLKFMWLATGAQKNGITKGRYIKQRGGNGISLKLRNPHHPPHEGICFEWWLSAHIDSYISPNSLGPGEVLGHQLCTPSRDGVHSHLLQTTSTNTRQKCSLRRCQGARHVAPQSSELC